MERKSAVIHAYTVIKECLYSKNLVYFSGSLSQQGEVAVALHLIFPSNTRHSRNAVSMLAHCLRRWPNIETALGECLVFDGLHLSDHLEPSTCVRHPNPQMYIGPTPQLAQPACYNALEGAGHAPRKILKSKAKI